MKKFFKYALILIGFDVLLFLLLALKPVPEPLTKAECLVRTGIVETVSGGGFGDVVISLIADDRLYYINRLSMQEDEHFERWYTLLKGKEVTLYYPNYLTPLDYAGKVRHLRMIEIEGQEVWSELGN